MSILCDYKEFWFTSYIIGSIIIYTIIAIIAIILSYIGSIRKQMYNICKLIIYTFKN